MNSSAGREGRGTALQEAGRAGRRPDGREQGFFWELQAAWNDWNFVEQEGKPREGNWLRLSALSATVMGGEKNRSRNVLS